MLHSNLEWSSLTFKLFHISPQRRPSIGIGFGHILYTFGGKTSPVDILPASRRLSWEGKMGNTNTLIIVQQKQTQTILNLRPIRWTSITPFSSFFLLLSLFSYFSSLHHTIMRHISNNLYRFPSLIGFLKIKIDI